jgi:F0F1-type ATP synthase alpha subunit
VITVGDGIANVIGLYGIQAGETVKFEKGVAGMVLNLQIN